MNVDRDGEEQLAAQLAAWDEALAKGDTPKPADTPNAPPDLQARLVRGLECMKLLHEARPRRRREDSSLTATYSPDYVRKHETDDSHFSTDTDLFSSSPVEKVLGRFQLRRELGRGGFGVVFLAYDPQLSREVALKVPRLDSLASSEFRERFQQEARAAAGLDHPNIVPVYESGEVGPVTYIASAYCPGVTLAAWIKQRTEPVPFVDAAELTATLADAVQHAHSRGVLHRDLKPANVLIGDRPSAIGHRPEGEDACQSVWPKADSRLPTAVKITDFGLAKLMDANVAGPNTKTGVVLGTPSYMAPEQAGGKTSILGPAVDVYALGAILYELLTGRPPFVGESDLETLLQIQNDDALPPSRLRPKLPRDLETICLKCLQKEPSARYGSAGGLGEDLRCFLRKEPILARPVGIVGRTWRWCRRRPAVAGLLAALILVVLAGLSGIIWQWQNAVAGRDDAKAGWSSAETGWSEARKERDDAVRSRDQAEEAFRRGLGVLDACLRENTEVAHVHGSVLLRRSLLEEVLRFYQEFLHQWNDHPEFQFDIARSYARVGWIRSLLGEGPGSVSAYEESCARFDRVLRADSVHPEAAAWAGRAYTNLAGSQSALGRPENADAAYKRARDILGRAVAGLSATLEERQLLAGTIRNYAAFLYNGGRRDEARPLFQEALRMLQELVRLHPDNNSCQTSLGLVYRGLGLYYQNKGNQKDARSAYEQAVKIHTALHQREPRQPFRRRDLAGAYHELGIHHQTFNQRSEAAQCQEKARDLLERLLVDYPEMAGYQVELSWVYNHLGMLEKAAQRWEEGIRWHQKADDILQRAVRDAPDHLDNRVKLGGNLHGQALCLKGLHRLDEAVALFDRAIEQQNLVISRQPATPLARMFLANHHAEKARILITLGRREETAAALRLVAQLQPDQANYVYDVAAQFAHLAASVGMGGNELSSAENAERTGYIEQSMNHLRQALTRGYKNVKQLKEDRRLAPLRQRDDFQKLVAELEKAAK